MLISNLEKMIVSLIVNLGAQWEQGLGYTQPKNWVSVPFHVGSIGQCINGVHYYHPQLVQAKVNAIIVVMDDHFE